jgi:hypothetical protein
MESGRERWVAIIWAVSSALISRLLVIWDMLRFRDWILVARDEAASLIP